MSAADILHPHRPEFERFLYASVGEDRNGYVVTVLSALARLNLDPWEETADLTALGGEAAGSRLTMLLSRLRDVQPLGRDNGKVARDLTLLLPTGSARESKAPGPSGAASRRIPTGAILAIGAIVLVALQVMFSGGPG